MRAQSSEDALSLLERVTGHYRDAESLHVEATIDSRSHNEYFESDQRSHLSAYTASGGRFRYEGQDSVGSGVIVSDGTTEWRLLPSFAQFAKAPTGTYFKSSAPVVGDNRAVYEAYILPRHIGFLDANLRAAHYAAPETLSVGGRSVRCTVIQFGTSDSSRQQPPNGGTSETTLWIDPASLTIAKERTISHSGYYYGSTLPPKGQTSDNVTIRTYTETAIDFKPDADTFTFHPPPDATEVTKLPSAWVGNKPDTVAAANAAAKKWADSFLGKPLPPLTVRDSAGNTTSLSAFKGHPLLIDIWATWCVPCLLDLPALQKIRASTKGSDLAIVGIDEDNSTLDAVNLLKRRGYDWQDFHFSRDVVQKLGAEAVPLIILTDAEGKIVYYHSGADDKALVAAIEALGEGYRDVSIN